MTRVGSQRHSKKKKLSYLEICRVRKWGKIKEMCGAGYEASTYGMARDVSEEYQFQTHLSLENQELEQSVANVMLWYRQKLLSHGYTLDRRVSTPSCPHSLNTFLVFSDLGFSYFD